MLFKGHVLFPVWQEHHRVEELSLVYKDILFGDEDARLAKRESLDRKGMVFAISL